MIGITIQDVDDRDVLTVDLIDILRFAGERALRSRWLLSGVEAGGNEAAEKLHLLSAAGLPVEGNQLMDLAKQVWQVIDGKFEGFDDESTSPWIIIIAVDSSAYDVVTDDKKLVDTLKEKFDNVLDLSSSVLEG
jgi:hypothetical protein